uniref:Integrase, catalytic region, zinc finger, CCHC-type, peptidase aspartic, catalytic n=1 Tax=Tanacetum cinerariifolium TaxID=118510 RepID=A0A6L2LQK9_TANCI|nr:hypothetical protein [Tanacetum cinerariifolium]
MILESVENGLLIWPTIEENRVTRTKKYGELYVAKKIQADCNIKATNIILQGLLANIYLLVNHHRVAKDLWERVQLLMQGTFLTKQERECKLFTYYQFDQLYAYLEQHELYANEVRLLRECNQDPLAFVANQQMTPPHFNTYQSSSSASTIFSTISIWINSSHSILLIYLSIITSIQSFIRSTIISISVSNESSNLICSTNCSSITLISTQPMTALPLMDSGLAVLVFSREDDPIACEGHMSRQSTQPRRLRNAAWVPDGQAVQTIIPNNAIFQTEDLDTYDFDCDDISNAKAVLMANIPTMVLMLSQRHNKIVDPSV